MSYIAVDIESDDNSPVIGSMVCFGAVLVSDMSKIFYGQTKPITDKFNPEALKISGFSREEHEKFPDPKETMENFAKWLKEVSIGKPTFISDNNSFDFKWIDFYFYKYLGYNPFGFSSRRIGDLYCGLVKDVSKNYEWKKLYRKTKHTHNPVDDSMGNAEALWKMKEMGLKIKF